MIFEPVPAHQRLLAALNELLGSARALAQDPTNARAISQRRWSLRLAERALDQLGGFGALPATEREQVEAIAARVAHLDDATRQVAEACRDRLLHAQAETRRSGGSLMNWTA